MKKIKLLFVFMFMSIMSYGQLMTLNYDGAWMRMSEIEVMSALLRDASSINWDLGTGKIVVDFDNATFTVYNQTALYKRDEGRTYYYDITDINDDADDYRLYITERGSNRRYVCYVKSGMMIFERVGEMSHSGWAYRVNLND